MSEKGKKGCQISCLFISQGIVPCVSVETEVHEEDLRIKDLSADRSYLL